MNLKKLFKRNHFCIKCVKCINRFAAASDFYRHKVKNGIVIFSYIILTRNIKYQSTILLESDVPNSRRSPIWYLNNRRIFNNKMPKIYLKNLKEEIELRELDLNKVKIVFNEDKALC